MVYTRQEFVGKLKEEDFTSKSITSFCKENGFSLQTTLNCLNKNDIPYNRRKAILNRNRDTSGKYSKGSHTQDKTNKKTKDYDKEAEKRINIAMNKKNKNSWQKLQNI